MRKSIIILILILVCMQSLMAGSAGQGNGFVLPGKEISKASLNTQFNLGLVPLYFIPNMGQYDKQAVFYARASRYTLWATAEGLVFDSIKGDKRDVSRMMFVNANPHPEITAVEKTNLRVNYFKGAKSDWRTDIPATQSVLYKNVYNKVDLKIYGIEKEVEYDWIVKANGNPEDVKFEYSHVIGSKIDAQGNLLIQTNFGQLTHKRPFSYQMIDGQQKEVHVRFKEIQKNVFGFSVAAYDKTRDLVIDPAVLVYSTYFGGTSNNDTILEVIIGANDQIYITGDTESNPGTGNFPITTNAYKTTRNGGQDAYVTIMEYVSNQLNITYSTYFGGSYSDYGRSLAVDTNGYIYLCGKSVSSNLPYVNSYQVCNTSNYNAYAAILDPTLGTNGLLFSTCLGGSNVDTAYYIGYDNLGRVMVSGYTQSTNFPVANSYQSALNGGLDMFVSLLDPQL